MSEGPDPGGSYPRHHGPLSRPDVSTTNLHHHTGYHSHGTGYHGDQPAYHGDSYHADQPGYHTDSYHGDQPGYHTDSYPGDELFTFPLTDEVARFAEEKKRQIVGEAGEYTGVIPINRLAIFAF